jgi:hypothetical protein
MKYINQNGKETIVPSLFSWIKTIKGVKLLCENMHKQGHRSILLINLNQDPLENFFGAIRAHGYSNIMPTAAACQGAYKTLIINNMSSTHSLGANCEQDGSVCLQNIQYFFYINDTAEETQTCRHPIDYNHLNININTNEILKSNLPRDIKKCAAIAYCSGWSIRAAKKNVYKDCVTCFSQLKSREMEEFHKIINNSEYAGQKWLCYPKRNVFDIFSHTEMIVNQIMKSMGHKKKYSYLNKTNCGLYSKFRFHNMHRNKLTEYLIKKCYVLYNKLVQRSKQNIVWKKYLYRTDRSDKISSSDIVHKK